MNIFCIIEKFNEWVIENSVYSPQYKNYMNSLMKKFFLVKFRKDCGIDLTNCFKDKATSISDSTQRFLVLCSCMLEVERDDKKGACSGVPETTWKLKTLEDYSSAWNAFAEFIVSEGYNVDSKIINSKCITEKLNKYSSKKIKLNYKKGKLEKIFLSRLTTQDRVYENILYPARLLNKVFNNSPYKEQYKELLYYVIGNARLIIGKDGETKPLDDITGISIEISQKNGVTVDCGTRTHLKLFTEGKTGIIELSAKKGVQDLSLDHDTPLENIINANAKAFPQLMKLSEIIASHEGCKSTDYRKHLSGAQNIKNWTKKVYNDCSTMLLDPTFLQDLFAEMETLYKKEIKLTVMHAADNSAKGKRI